MVCSGSLAPRFLDNDYVTAETICSTAHAHHKVLSESQATLCDAHIESGSIIAVSWLCLLGQTREKRIQCVYSHDHCASQERPCVVLGYAVAAAVSARRE